MVRKLIALQLILQLVISTLSHAQNLASNINSVSKTKLKTDYKKSYQMQAFDDYAKLLGSSSATYYARATNAVNMMMSTKGMAQGLLDQANSMVEKYNRANGQVNKTTSNSNSEPTNTQEDPSITEEKPNNEIAIKPKDLSSLQEEMTSFNSEFLSGALAEKQNISNYDTQTSNQSLNIEKLTEAKNKIKEIKESVSSAKSKDQKESNQKTQSIVQMASGVAMLGVGIALMSNPTTQQPGMIKVAGAMSILAAATSLVSAFMQSKADSAATNFGNGIKADNALMKTLCDRDRHRAIEKKSLGNSFCGGIENGTERDLGKDISETPILSTELLSPIGKKAALRFSQEFGVPLQNVIQEALKDNGDLRKFVNGKGFDNFLKRHVPDENLQNLIKKSPVYKNYPAGKTSQSTYAKVIKGLGNNIIDKLAMNDEFKNKSKKNLESYVKKSILGDSDIRGQGKSAVQAEKYGMKDLLSETDSELTTIFGDYEENLESTPGESEFEPIQDREMASVQTKAQDPEFAVEGSLFSRIRSAVKRNHFKIPEPTKVDADLLKKRLEEFSN